MSPEELRGYAIALNPNDCKTVEGARAVTNARIALHDAADEIIELRRELEAWQLAAEGK